MSLEVGEGWQELFSQQQAVLRGRGDIVFGEHMPVSRVV